MKSISFLTGPFSAACGPDLAHGSCVMEGEIAQVTVGGERFKERTAGVGTGGGTRQTKAFDMRCRKESQRMEAGSLEQIAAER